MLTLTLGIRYSIMKCVVQTSYRHSPSPPHSKVIGFSGSSLVRLGSRLFEAQFFAFLRCIGRSLGSSALIAHAGCASPARDQQPASARTPANVTPSLVEYSEPSRKSIPS